MYKEIKNMKIKDSDPEIISWQRGNNQDTDSPLMYVYPQLGEDIKKKRFFAVKDYEKAIFYDRGVLVDVLGGGVYELDKKARTKGTEIVWIDTSLIEIQWGIPQSSGIPTKDGVIIGLHGNLKLRINDAKNFYTNVIAGKKAWTGNDLKNWIINLLHTALRDVFKNYTAKSVLLEERDRVVTLLTSKITDDFMSYGLDLDTIDIIGLKTSEGMEKLYRLEREKASISDELEILKTKKELNSLKREISSEEKAYGRKEEILDASSDLELTKIKAEEQSIEKQVEYTMLEKEEQAKVAGELKVIKAKGEEAVKIAEIESSKHKVEEPKLSKIRSKISELKEKLNQFDDMLAEGKISQEVYKLRVTRIEKEINDLELKL